MKTGLTFDELEHGLKQGLPTTTTTKLNRDSTVAVATDVFWNEDMSTCPRGCKVQLLGAGGVALYATYDGKEQFFKKWAPLPRNRTDQRATSVQAAITVPTVEPLMDSDGENRAVRFFLAFYGGNSGIRIVQMMKNLGMAGVPYWPDWCDAESSSHLTKAGAQLWLRYLFDLERF